MFHPIFFHKVGQHKRTRPRDLLGEPRRSHGGLQAIYNFFEEEIAEHLIHRENRGVGKAGAIFGYAVSACHCYLIHWRAFRISYHLYHYIDLVISRRNTLRRERSIAVLEDDQDCIVSQMPLSLKLLCVCFAKGKRVDTWNMIS